MSIIDGSTEYEVRTMPSKNELNISDFAHTFLDDTSANEVRNTLDLASKNELGYRQPNTTYSVGNIAYHNALPTGWYLECTTEGMTGSGDLTISSPVIGGTVTDGTVIWMIVQNFQRLSMPSLDLNDFTREGIYKLLDVKRNIPLTQSSFWGNLMTLNTAYQMGAGGEFLAQVLYDAPHSDIYYRQKADNTSWSQWQRLATADDISSYLPLSGGAMTGETISRTASDSFLRLSGTNYNQNKLGATLLLCGGDRSSHSGSFNLIAEKENYSSVLDGYPDGNLYWNKNDLGRSAIVAKSLGKNGYIKYASGLIMQWGDDNIFQNKTIINFPISFTQDNYKVLLQGNDSSYTYYDQIPLIGLRNVASFEAKVPSRGITFSWLAIGI